MALRGRAQLERTPRQFIDHQQAERRATLRALTDELRRARERNEPWYLWLKWRAEGVHRHDLLDEQGRAIACPVAGCDAVRGCTEPHRLPPRSSRSRV
jgi:hypothetical protein